MLSKFFILFKTLTFALSVIEATPRGGNLIHPIDPIHHIIVTELNSIHLVDNIGWTQIYPTFT
jgi:hypothetical protein